MPDRAQETVYHDGPDDAKAAAMAATKRAGPKGTLKHALLRKSGTFGAGER
jgi:hypothetical protein